jgi:hypothetical protein
MGMLQKYDTLKSSILLAIAAAGGLTIAPFATAEVACNGADGYGPTVATYVTEASACIAASDAIKQPKRMHWTWPRVIMLTI